MCNNRLRWNDRHTYLCSVRFHALEFINEFQISSFIFSIRFKCWSYKVDAVQKNAVSLRTLIPSKINSVNLYFITDADTSSTHDLI